MRFIAALILFAATTSVQAYAHTGTGSGFAFLDGALHPMLGIDHVLTMVGVGLWAALAGGPAKWVWPVTFVSSMTIGGALALAAIDMAHVEHLILASVIAVGVAIACRAQPTLAGGAAICAAMALAHGHAHGTELPLQASPTGYVAGFMVVTMTLHLVGIGIGSALQRHPSALRCSGALIATTGAWLAFA